MRNIIFTALLLYTYSLSMGQMIISGKVQPNEILVFNVPFDYMYHSQKSQRVYADKFGNFLLELPVTRPQTIFLDLAGVRLHLYAEPEGKLILDQTDSIQFSGKLGKENEFWRKIGLTYNLLGETFSKYAFSNPSSLLKKWEINQLEALMSLTSASPSFSKTFIQMTRANIIYFPASKIRDLMLQNRSSTYLSQWKSAVISTHENIPLSDSNAVNSYHYQKMMANYKYFLEEKTNNPEEFMAVTEKIFQKPFELINKEVQSKGERYWEYKVLTYTFENEVLDYGLASFIINGILKGDLDYIQEAYYDYCLQYPNNRYLSQVQEAMQPYLKSRFYNEDSGIHFVQGENIQDLDAILNQFRGRVLYIDLWGTWCRPCRSEFTFNKALKENFASKEVTFVYIAVEHSPDPEKKWKETVKFYDLSGYHILASKTLEEDLRKRYDQDGMLSLPSYILVDKTGKVVTMNARRPSEKEALYQQINEQL